MQYANTNRTIPLAYPAALFNDTTPPQISTVAASGAGVITWTTDEFATSTVFYGTQSGTYPETASDPLYTKEHVITLTGLTPGTTYFYYVRSADRSDNLTDSAEYSFTVQVYVYLPVVLR